METIYLILRADGTDQSVAVDLPADPGIDAVRAIVMPVIATEGPRVHMERVAVLYEGRACDMFVDELGLSKGLPRNEAATAVYRANWLTQHPGTDPESLPCVVGDAVLFNRRVWF